MIGGEGWTEDRRWKKVGGAEAEMGLFDGGGDYM